MAKDWTGNSKTAYSVLGASNHSSDERQCEDYYATDPKALKLFLDKIELDGIKLHKDIWECACGEGHLSKELENEGYNVWSTGLSFRIYIYILRGIFFKHFLSLLSFQELYF